MLFKDGEVDAQRVQLKENTIHTSLHAPVQALSLTDACTGTHMQSVASQRGQHYCECLYELEKTNRE